MNIIKANVTYAELIGQIHSVAWKQAYNNIFTDDYIFHDSPEKRKIECIETLLNKNGYYYLINIGNVPIGIIKVSTKERGVCEIEGLYILNDFQNRGYGTTAINFIKNEFSNMTVMLWVLEINNNAINFYEKNSFIFTGKKRKIFRGNEYTQLQFSYHNVLSVK